MLGLDIDLFRPIKSIKALQGERFENVCGISFKGKFILGGSLKWNEILLENTSHTELPLKLFIGKNVVDIDENLSDYNPF